MLCFVLSALGTLIDWLLRKSHRKAILARLHSIESKLSTLSAFAWQQNIFKWIRGLWAIYTSLGRSMVLHTAFEHPMKSARYIAFTIVAWLVAMVAGQVLFTSELHAWMPSILITGLMPYAWLWLGLFAIRLVAESGLLPLTNPEIKPLLELYILPLAIYDFLAPVVFVNGALSYCALAATHTSSYALTLPSPFTISLIHLPFTVTTIAISIIIFRIGSRSSAKMIWAALCALAAASLVSVIELTTLILISNEEHAGLSAEMYQSALWLSEILTVSISTDSARWQVTPLLLTAYLPVVVYTVTILFLGFVLRPIMFITQYIAGLLFEKEQTPFLALGLTLSMILTFLKLLKDWDWIWYKLSQ